MRISTLISVRITFFFRFFLFLRIFVPFFSFPCFSQTPYDVFSCVQQQRSCVVTFLGCCCFRKFPSRIYCVCGITSAASQLKERQIKYTNPPIWRFTNSTTSIAIFLLFLLVIFLFFLLVRIYEEGMRYSVENNITAWRHTVEDQRRWCYIEKKRKKKPRTVFNRERALRSVNPDRWSDISPSLKVIQSTYSLEHNFARVIRLESPSR